MVYRWNAKDRKTRFKLYGFTTRKRSYKKGALRLYCYIKSRFYDQFKERKEKGKPIKFISDKLAHYKKGFNKTFRKVAELVHGVPIACKKYGLKHNNNCAERDNERIKQRYKVMRSFGDLKSANEILDFLDIFYNFLDEMKLEKEKRYRTPAQRAGIKLKFRRFKLLKLIRYVKLSGTAE